MGSIVWAPKTDIVSPHCHYRSEEGDIKSVAIGHDVR